MIPVIVHGKFIMAEEAESPKFSLLGFITRMFIFYMIYTRFMSPSTPVSNTGEPLPPHMNLWRNGQVFDLRVYLSELQDPTINFDTKPMVPISETNEAMLVWYEKGLKYDWNDRNARNQNLTLNPSSFPHLYLNGSLYAHVFLTKRGYSPDPLSDDHVDIATIYRHHALIRYMPAISTSTKKLLLDVTNTTDIEPVKQDAPYISYWVPTLHLNVIHDFSTFPRGGIPKPMHDMMQFHELSGDYYPTLYFNEFWLMREHMNPVNETVKELSLEFTFDLLSLWKWQLYSQMEQSWELQQSMGSTENEIDEIKHMLVDTNPILLGVTMVVSILHMVFDTLAFKNDIQFWKERDTLEGISVRTIVLNTVCQVIILLYLLDNETSWMILFSAFIGIGIEAWKIQKAMHVTIDRSGRFPMLRFHDKASYTASKTKEHDQQAMKYLSYLLYPLVIGYSIYSLVYDEHKSWYSWVVGSLVGAVYTFGFIMMTPQLWINYKLKSVENMPGRVFAYRALNTFIDDLFAFIIRMPTMHRLSCFRDDIVFFIYLYQRWIYPVDKSRACPEMGGGSVKTSETQELLEESSTETQEPKESQEEGEEENTIRQRNIKNQEDMNALD